MASNDDYDAAMMIASQEAHIYHGSVTLPVSMSTTFSYHKQNHLDDIISGVSKSFTYSRDNNPTIRTMEIQIEKLHCPATLAASACSEENQQTCVAFSSGMASIAAVVCSLLCQGSHVLCSEEMYTDVFDLLGSLKTLAGLNIQRSRFIILGISSSFVDFTNLQSTAEWLNCIGKDPKRGLLVMLESCSNPHGKVPDFEALFSLVRQKFPNAIIMVDNTWLSPIIFKPLAYV